MDDMLTSSGLALFRSETIRDNWMVLVVVESYPNLKEEVDCEISSPLDKTNFASGRLPHVLWCWCVGLLLSQKEWKEGHLPVFLHSFEVFFFSKMIGNCLEISNFNWLFLELGRFIYYTLPVLPVECPTNIYFIHSAPPQKGVGLLLLSVLPEPCTTPSERGSYSVYRSRCAMVSSIYILFVKRGHHLHYTLCGVYLQRASTRCLEVSKCHVRWLPIWPVLCVNLSNRFNMRGGDTFWERTNNKCHLYAF